MRTLLCLLLTAIALPGVEVVPLHLDGLLQPQVAVGADGTVHVVGVTPDAAGSDVVYRRRPPGGAFGAARTVNDQAKSATCIGSIRGARLALGRADSVHVAWNGRDGKAVWYSRDFAPQRNLLPAADGVDGGGALAADAQGRVAVVFHHQAGATDEEGRQVAVVASSDDGVTLAAPRALAMPARGVCGCCSLAAGLDAQGRVEVLVRNAAAGARDIWFLSGGGTGRDLGPWRIAACPLSTAAYLRRGDATYLAWEQQGQVWWCQTGRAPVACGPGKHPALAVDAAGTVLVAWAAGTGWNRGGDVRWQAYDPRGAALGAPGTQPGLPAWGTPAAFVEGPGRFTILY